MKSFYRLLKYIFPYWKYAVAYLGATIFSIIFSLVSLTMLIPFLSLLFGKQELVTEVSPLTFKVESIIEHFSYYLSQIIIEKGSVNALIFICFTVVILIFLKNFFTYMATYYLVPVRYKVLRDIRQKVYGKILNLPISYFNAEKKGDLMSRMSGDLQEVEWSVLTSVSVFFKEPLTILVFIGAMFYISPQLTMMILILLPVSGFFINLIGRSLKKQSKKGQELLGSLMSMIDETLDGLRIIKAFDASTSIFNKFKDENKKHHRIQIKMNRKRTLSSPMSETLSITVLAIVMYFGGRSVLSEDSTLNAATFITYLGIFAQVVSPAKAFSNAFYNIMKGTASLERIEQILNADETIKDKPNALEIKEFNNSIEFKDIHFAYNDTPIIKGVSFEIKKGETIALVGSSGAGKSTIADLLPRFYDISKGEILVDGLNVKDVKNEYLMKLMGIVTQESVLFNDSIYNNIAFGKPTATKEMVEEAARIANAHDFIMETDAKYDTIIGDRGGNLSGGQRQRLSIARAILKNPSILILDEATSALDTESEKLVQDALDSLMQNRTTLVIAHRLSTIRHANKILVMEDGRISEEGQHDELVAKGGIYAKLCSMQAFD
ncbi:MAG: subfamily B ATP-binding cassette protein MsbA [Sphingobacteriales bacterium]|jgi:subfamily B ATP-binding cassette protein MsbA